MPQTYKVDEQIPKFKFSECFTKAIDELLKTYQETLTELEKISKNPSSYINETFGVCNNRYKMRYITPSDISTYVGYLAKVIIDRPFPIENVNDMEIMSVAMLQRFVNDNEKCIPFEDTNAYGANANFDQRNIDLGKLVVMCGNEFYDTSVYSKSDMESRAKAMAADIKTIKDMKFDTNTKKLVNAIPKILEENCPDIKYSLKTRKLVNESVTRFIETACAINLCTVQQMIGYCVPNKSFNIVKEIKNPNKRMDYDFYDESVEISEVEEDTSYMVQEAVDLSKVKPVFVNLATSSSNFCADDGGDNFVSNNIKKITGEKYSHSSIGFDVQLNKLYTMNGGFFYDNVYRSQKSGFQYEAIRSSKYRGIRVTIYCALVPNEVYDRMLAAADKMAHSKAKYDYKACADRAKALLFEGKNANPAHSDNQRKQICSTLVNSLMAIAGEPMGNKEIVSPGELGESALTKPRQFFCVYDGPGDGYDPKLAQEKIEDFAKRPSTKVFGEKTVTEYYTECCLLKTNDLRIRSKIPFNCNMRDIVLQDMHPLFKDTESAIMFMISDERSPITSLLRKYRTIEKVQPNFRVLNMFMHIKPADFCSSKDPYHPMNELGFHTDPNWLDKITYGNQFLDGNYRSDAVGNNKFSPMEDTLNHLYSMYCCEGLKTNTELANHIVDVSNTMVGIINQYKCGDCKVCNWEMLRDILAVLGEILTRTMLKLYDNNTIIFTISDNMDDAAAPGYMYTESFEEYLDDMYLEEAQPSIKVDSNKTGLAKLMGNVRELIRKFIRWIQDKFMNITNNFEKKYQAQIEWVSKNQEMINKIKTALDSNFVVNLNNYSPFNIKVENIKKISEALQNYVKDYKTNSENRDTVSALAIVQSVAKHLDESGGVGNVGAPETGPGNGDVKKICQNILNKVLYDQPTVPESKNTQRLNGEMFNDIANNIIGCGKLIDASVKELSNSMKRICAELENEVKQQESAQKQPQTEGNPQNENPEPEKNGDASTLSKEFINVCTMLVNPIVDAFDKKVFLQSYKLFRDVVSAYNTQFNASTDTKPSVGTDNKDNAANADNAGKNQGET